MNLTATDLDGIEASYYALLFRRHREINSGRGGSFWEIRHDVPGTGYLALVSLEDILEKARRLGPDQRLTNRYYHFSASTMRDRLERLRYWTDMA
ncbi:hypothetical protein BH24DEI1_BH24DEI1_14760 [soil metagenome]|jgi:hypothetical protein|nr:hypothetical protein [Deinococcota bacterium]